MGWTCEKTLEAIKAEKDGARTAEAILDLPAFGVRAREKEEIYLTAMESLTEYHRGLCKEYKNILEILGYTGGQARRLEDIPMLPVSLFKDFSLSSIKQEDVFKILSSSGTTGQVPSKILLDGKTAALQQKALLQIVGDFVGNKRLPMIIMDTEDVLRDRRLFSARGAGILGFSIFASDRCFILDKNMELDMEKAERFLEKHRGEDLLAFGFTYMVWTKVYKKLEESGKSLDLSKAYLIHGGGWKKLKDQEVSPERFAEGLRKKCKIAHLSNYYGMAEQTGTIYMECECGHLHVSSYSEMIVRNMKDFSLCQTGEEGVIQVMSPIALSYPGHSLLTEDKGYLAGADNCPCGRKGKYFKITGRIRKAEIRGCSDTYGE